MNPSAILLFAAGLGTRMAPLTETQPKPMIRVGGKPLLDHALDQCAGLRTVVNIHYLGDQIRTHLKGTPTLISDETGLLRDTGGGLKHALPLLGESPVYTLNTDAVWLGANPVQTLAAQWQPDRMDALLLLIPKPNAIAHTGSGDFDLDDDQRLMSGSDYVYSGLQITRTEHLGKITEDVFSMWALWSEMLDQKKMFGAVYDGQWCDVGRPDCIPIAEEMLRRTDHV